VIRYEAVIIRYPRAAANAVQGVSVEALRGRITAVVGPNGSGKSTLVRGLLGRLPLTGGRITIDEKPLETIERRSLATRVAVVTQREELPFPMRVFEYVSLGRFPHLGAWNTVGGSDRAAIDGAIERTGVGPLAARSVDALSGGEWQRVRLARALAQGGEALVLDEPTTFLDVGHEMAVFELLYRLARGGQAVLLVSHQLNLVARFADSIVLLHDGRVAAAGTAEEVMQASILERVYDWPLVVTRDPAVGAPALLPLRGRPRI
jgi:iron complex transport system ATP-binding protein